MRLWDEVVRRTIDGVALSVHVIPLDDLEIHPLKRCWCIPMRLLEEGKLPIFVHNAFDGRQLKEHMILGRN